MLRLAQKQAFHLSLAQAVLHPPFCIPPEQSAAVGEGLIFHCALWQVDVSHEEWKAETLGHLQASSLLTFALVLRLQARS